LFTKLQKEPRFPNPSLAANEDDATIALTGRGETLA
jgi:hypothetical protein